MESRRRPIPRLRNAPSAGKMRTNADAAVSALSAFAASPGPSRPIARRMIGSGGPCVNGIGMKR